MKIGIGGRFALVAAVASALLLGAGIGLVSAIDAAHNAANEARRTERVLARADEAQRLATDLQTAPQLFAATGREPALLPWTEAQRELPSKVDEWVGLIRNETQRTRADAIDDAMRQYIIEVTIPLVELARRDRTAAQRQLATGADEGRATDIAHRFDDFRRAQRALNLAFEEEARRSKDQATTLTVVLLSSSVVLILLLSVYAGSAIARPVRRAAAAASAVSGGDLSVRLEAAGPPETRALARDFNAMTEALQEGMGDLEARNVELERQQAEFERQNVELELQQANLQDTLAVLDSERGRVQGYFDFAQQLARQTSFDECARLVLHHIADTLGADVGACYAARGEAEDEVTLVLARGLDPAALPARLGPDSGILWRAFDERTALVWEHDTSALGVRTLAGKVAVRGELHLPLLAGETRIGALTLGRASSPFSADDVEIGERMAAHGALGLLNARALMLVREQARVTRTVLDTIPDGVRMVDLEGRTVLENAPMMSFDRQIIPVSAARGGSGNAAALEELAEASTDAEKVWAYIRQIVEHPGIPSDLEFTHAASGRTFQRASRPVADEAGRLTGRVVAVHEVTAEREVQRLKDEFLALLSHELRTPLTSILGYTEMLQAGAGGELTPDQAHLVDVVDRNAERLLRLVGDVLLVAQSEAGRLSFEMAPTNIAEIVSGCVDSARPAAAEKEIHLESAVDALTIPLINGDGPRLEQAIDNLVTNAVKYTPRGGSVRVSLEGSGDSVTATVTDTGIGISAADQENLFERFFRADQARSKGISGVGLGLSVTQAIVEGHGGRLSVESREGHGSTFRMTLPTVRAPAPQQ